ncbi:hypothetical protein MSSIT_1591 [Methanosarcina siciliae T4/M]|uniref:Uncharacterized protein n=1 Tax=Methanosarcina siciliae T4/M TaxID=1434120 RepID=A0A0E3P439_9EURY|nr:hypothetical protein [Methanosarcina siciliae]AKB28310.1 hypothetical protein MSSIT_1591 [Methanosarcina siciliae T4/M]
MKDGGISLKHCTATFDGKRAVIEYIADGWGKQNCHHRQGWLSMNSEKTGRCTLPEYTTMLHHPEKQYNFIAQDIHLSLGKCSQTTSLTLFSHPFLCSGMLPAIVLNILR